MKNILNPLFLAAAFAFILMSCGNKIDQQHSRENAVNSAVFNADQVKSAAIIWTGYKITGSYHSGTLKLKNSQLNFNDGELIGGSMEIDMQSLLNTDLKGGKKSKLEGHLKSDDFFDVENFPIALFAFDNAKPSETQGEYVVDGSLTIKDITIHKTFITRITFENDEVTAVANFNIDRTKFGIKYGSGNFFQGLGDNVIKDDFNLDIRIVSQINEIGHT